MAEEKCFIIMPISTPPDLVDIYSGDDEHFRHVLEHLFIPALERTGIEPVLPIVEGANIIQGEIIRNIETSDYALCDMSALNPNVFFELGIRTAINKPLALVIDEITAGAPFDLSIINYHQYNSSLSPWTLEAEIRKLSKHFKNCFESPHSENSLWKYFSLSTQASSVNIPSSDSNALEYLTMQIEALRNSISEIKNAPRIGDISIEQSKLIDASAFIKDEGVLARNIKYEELKAVFLRIASEYDFVIRTISKVQNNILLIANIPNLEIYEQLQSIAKDGGFSLHIMSIADPSA